MIQKFTIYRVGNLPATAHQLGEQLQALQFFATTATQESAVGFAPPRAEHGAFVEAVAGQWIARLVIERRKVPTSAIAKRVDEQAAQIEEQTGRKPGRKERKALKEDALLALLPQAFPKQVAVPVWIDPQARLLVIGATSQAVIDDAITALVRAVDGLTLSLLNTKITPATAMASWLCAPETTGPDFSLGRECELKSNDEEKAVVRYSRHHLQGEEIVRHVGEGKRPRRLALDWNGRVSFRLSESMAIDKVQLLDLGDTPPRDEADDAFDADVAIYTGELSAMVADLIEALGGELQPQEGGAQ